MAIAIIDGYSAVRFYWTVFGFSRFVLGVTAFAFAQAFLLALRHFHKDASFMRQRVFSHAVKLMRVCILGLPLHVRSQKQVDLFTYGLANPLRCVHLACYHAFSLSLVGEVSWWL